MGQNCASPSSVTWLVFPGQRTWSATAVASAIIGRRLLQLGLNDGLNPTKEPDKLLVGLPPK
jgi:hypothetical protein